MTTLLSRRVVRAAVAAGVLGGGLSLAGAPPAAVSAPPPRAAAPLTLFAFGREGGNIRPLTVTIDATGLVTATTGTATSPPHLTTDALDGLLTLARAEGFFALPSRIVGHGLPDVAGRFITIHTATTTKTVHVRFAPNAAFDQLYAVLAAASGVAS